VLHIGTPRYGIPGNEFTVNSEDMTGAGRSTTDYWVRYSLGAMLFAGVFDRYPHLKIGSVEHETMWILHWLQQMDFTYRERPVFTKGYATVAARQAEMEMRQHEAARRAKLTTLSISDEAREDAMLTGNSATASYQQALADRSAAQLNLDRTVLRAPVNGYVTNLTLDVGQYAAVGTKVMALIDSDSYRVTAYFEETKIPAVKGSGHVDIYLMSGGPVLRGHVESISRGITDRDNPAGPELLTNANPTFEWVRLAQRIPVRIHIDDVPKGVVISSGMTCTVVVETPPRPWAVLAALRRWQAAAR
jgi:multidrug resistance efflux pump